MRRRLTNTLLALGIEMTRLSALKTLLLEHYSADLKTIFKQFRNGALAFGGGLMLVFYANTQLEPSLQQELLVLFALVLVGAGFIIAMLAQVRMVIGRFVQFFSRKP